MGLSSNLLGHEFTHLLLTFLAIFVTFFLFLRKKKKKSSKYIFLIVLGAFLGEFFLDSDHVFDYLFQFGLQFRPDWFFGGLMFHLSHKAYVIFHAWEWVILLGIILYFTKKRAWKYFLTALLLGMVFHLVYDTYFNHALLFGYSIMYRAIHHFDAQYFGSLKG